MMTVRETMSEAWMVVHPDATVGLAFEIFGAVKRRHLPVIDGDGSFIGLLSARALGALSVPYFVGDEYVGDVQAAYNAPIGDLVDVDVPSIDAEADALEAAELMLECAIEALPVVNADGVFVGIVNYDDVLRAMLSEHAA